MGRFLKNSIYFFNLQPIIIMKSLEEMCQAVGPHEVAEKCEVTYSDFN